MAQQGQTWIRKTTSVLKSIACIVMSETCSHGTFIVKRAAIASANAHKGKLNAAHANQ